MSPSDYVCAYACLNGRLDRPADDSFVDLFLHPTRPPPCLQTKGRCRQALANSLNDWLLVSVCIYLSFCALTGRLVTHVTRSIYRRLHPLKHVGRPRQSVSHVTLVQPVTRLTMTGHGGHITGRGGVGGRVADHSWFKRGRRGQAGRQAGSQIGAMCNVFMCLLGP